MMKVVLGSASVFATGCCKGDRVLSSPLLNLSGSLPAFRARVWDLSHVCRLVLHLCPAIECTLHATRQAMSVKIGTPSYVGFGTHSPCKNLDKQFWMHRSLKTTGRHSGSTSCSTSRSVAALTMSSMKASASSEKCKRLKANLGSIPG